MDDSVRSKQGCVDDDQTSPNKLLATFTLLRSTGTAYVSLNSRRNPLKYQRSVRVMMLSEKAKGKQRAIEPPDEPEPELFRDLVIRFTEGLPDLILKVSQKDAIRDVKANVRSSLIE